MCRNKLFYVIRPGDTLHRIAQNFDTTTASIIEENPRINLNNLTVGTTIGICPGDNYGMQGIVSSVNTGGSWQGPSVCLNKVSYTVRQGDTLHRIAQNFDTTVSDILAYNPRINPGNLSVGTIIEVCPGGSYNLGNIISSVITGSGGRNTPPSCRNKQYYTVRAGDTLYRIARYFDTTVPEILAENPRLNPRNLTAGTTIGICPGDGYNNQYTGGSSGAGNVTCRNKLSYTVRQGDTLHRIAQYFRTTVPDIIAVNPRLNPRNLSVGTTITICPGDSYNIQNPGNAPVIYGNNRAELTDEMRHAWMQQAYWTRLLLVSVAGNLNDQEEAAKRLMQSPYNIMDIFDNYYNKLVTVAIERLLTEFLEAGAEYLAAVNDGRSADAENIKRKWYVTAALTAKAFAALNPNYSEQTLQNMMNRLIDLTAEEIKLRIAGNHSGEIEAFNRVERQTTEIADYFTEGIVKQFPQKFR